MYYSNQQKQAKQYNTTNHDYSTRSLTEYRKIMVRGPPIYSNCKKKIMFSQKSKTSIYF